jgi:carboxyl-terminal processing protease
VSAQQIQALAEAVEGDDEVVTSAVVNGVLHLRIRRFVADIGRRVFNATRGHEDAPITIDLRGNPGGDAHAALSLMDDFTPQGSTLAVLVQDGEHLPQRARAPQSYGGPLTILVDAETASAAEVFAGGLRALGRARLIGETTAGKGSVQALCSNRDRDGFTYESVAEYRLPDGRPIHGAGLIPDDDG